MHCPVSMRRAYPRRAPGSANAHGGPHVGVDRADVGEPAAAAEGLAEAEALATGRLRALAVAPDVVPHAALRPDPGDPGAARHPQARLREEVVPDVDALRRPCV